MRQPVVKKEAALFLEAIVGFLISKIVANLYTEVAKKVKKLAIRYLNNQFVLNYIASHDKDPQLRVEAASKLISPVLLRKLLMKEPKDDVRVAILSKLRVADLVREYRRSGLKSQYKLRLIHLAKTQDEIYKLLSEENDKELIKVLLSMVTSPRVIERVRSLPQPEVQQWVEEKLWAKRRKEEASSQLDQLLKSEEPSPSLCHQVSNPRIWYLVALRHKNQKVKSEAISRLEGKKNLLTRLETNPNLDTDLRLQAATLLGTDLVSSIAKTDLNSKMRMRAVALLDPKKDAETISAVMKSEKKSDVLTQAILITTSVPDLEALRTRIDPKVSPHLLKILEDRISTMEAAKVN